MCARNRFQNPRYRHAKPGPLCSEKCRILDSKLEIRIGIPASEPRIPRGSAGFRASVPFQGGPTLADLFILFSGIMAPSILRAVRGTIMRQSHRADSRTRILFAAAWGTVCVWIIAAPFLALHSCHTTAATIYFLFSCICHQIPERCFTLSGYSLAVCHRCAGMYFGFLLGSLYGIRVLHRSVRARRLMVLTAIALMLLDVLASAAGLWNSTAGRAATGLLFGIVISSLLVRGVSEFLHEAPWRQRTTDISQLKGGLS